MLERWDTAFNPKVIKEAKHQTQSIELRRLLKAAEKLAENDNDTNWDSDMAFLLLLLHLLPPTAGRKRIKISPTDAVDKMVHFHKSCCSIDEHLEGREDKQPYILAVAKSRAESTLSTSSLTNSSSPAKPPAHWTAVYNIDVTSTDESPRVREFRAKLFN
ncbi:hypothetical protein LDENG_00250830 [Lucifuga dentata]|nr:hypothetical protein LDENG_00250830 [Lucifuga dentata]